MAGQHLCFARDGQLCQLAQAVRHLCAAAALKVGAADAACKQRIAAEQMLTAQQHHAAGGVAGGVPRSKVQLVHRDLLPFRVAAVRSGKRVHPVAGKVCLFTVEGGVPLCFQRSRAAHMVVVAVGAQNGGEGGVVLL